MWLKSKADYAFLLHELHHIKPDGILTIVLPHGVLFRGDPEKDADGEGKIRKNLIEKNNIDVIIGLPENIFFGTNIPTIIMVLKQRRSNDDVLFIDASKGFVKAGSQNILRAGDIRRITDAVRERKSILDFLVLLLVMKFARMVIISIYLVIWIQAKLLCSMISMLPCLEVYQRAKLMRSTTTGKHCLHCAAKYTRAMWTEAHTQV